MNIFKYFCHQRPDRSFFIRGHQFPLCARCTGILIGAISYGIYTILTGIPNGSDLIIWSIILQLPYIIDGTTQYFKLRESNNILRLITGIIGGVGVMMLSLVLCYLLETIFML